MSGKKIPICRNDVEYESLPWHTYEGHIYILPSEIPKIDTRWRHTNGNHYIIYDVTNLHSTNLEKYPIRISYRGDNGFTWSRNLDDWHRSMTKVEKC
jgi:hypothetical protein